MIWGCILAAGYEELHLVEESWKRGSTFRYCREYIQGALKTLELKKGDTIFQQGNDPKHTSKLASNCVTVNSSCSH